MGRDMLVMVALEKELKETCRPGGDSAEAKPPGWPGETVTSTGSMEIPGPKPETVALASSWLKGRKERRKIKQ